ncbi:MAG: choice-of-anchor tandem repeat GloVer-containing protein, partial [Thermoanaerobaculia bacterium]
MRGFRSSFERTAVLAVITICIFAATATAQTYEILASFNSPGVGPSGSLIQGTDGNLYGTTESGGAGAGGTIFKIDTNGSTLTTLHSFAYSDGASPHALIQATDGNLYGTTLQGGANGQGTIFKIDTNGTTLTTLHNFVNSDGANPTAGLIQGTDENLYGTTQGGG